MSSSVPNVNVSVAGGPEVLNGRTDGAASIADMQGKNFQASTSLGQQIEFAVDDNITVFKESVAVSQEEISTSQARASQIKKQSTTKGLEGFEYEKR